MGRTKTQREIRDFLMALVIKTHQNNNNKKHKFFWGGIGTYQFILETNLVLMPKKTGGRGHYNFIFS
jgi:hypothetical protein